MGYIPPQEPLTSRQTAQVALFQIDNGEAEGHSDAVMELAFLVGIYEKVAADDLDGSERMGLDHAVAELIQEELPGLDIDDEVAGIVVDILREEIIPYLA